MDSCVAFASVRALGQFFARKAGDTTEYYPLFMYNLCRIHDGNLAIDAGSLPDEAVQILVQIGMVPESVFPYPTSVQQQDSATLANFYTDPPSDAILAQAHRLFHGYKSIDSTLELRQSLAAGIPVLISLDVYDSFMKVGSDGMVPIPSSSDQYLGGHEVLCVGYDDQQRYFIIQNSWGTTWGDQGFAYLPYDYVRLEGNVYQGFTVTP